MKKLSFFCLWSVLILQNAFSDLTWTADSFNYQSNWSQLKGEHFSDLNLYDKDLTGIDLSGCVFNNCTLSKVILKNANFTGSIFNGGTFNKVLIEGTNLKDVQFNETIFSSVQLVSGINNKDVGIGCSVPNRNGNHEAIISFIAQQLNLSNQAKDQKDKNDKDRIRKNYLQRAADAMTSLILCMKFNLSSYDFKKKNLSGYNFSYCNLSEANLSHCNLSKANLSGCNISGTDFSSADLKKANLEGAFTENRQHPILINTKVSDKSRLPSYNINPSKLAAISRKNREDDGNIIYGNDEDARNVLRPLLIAMKCVIDSKW